MRLGGSIMKPYHSPQEWLTLVREYGYSAVIFPVNSDAPRQARRDYLQCCRDNDLLIGEVGVWRNVLAADPKEAAANMDYAVRQLELAEEVGANCCVNIAGSLGALWDGYDPAHGTRAYYDRVVETTRRIIDAVQPVHTCFTLEPMAWMCPESPEEYLQLLKDVDRPSFKVHLDYCNMISSLDRYRRSGAFIRRCFELLGEHIVSIHAKDVLLRDGALPLVIEEIQPGEGSIDLPLVCALADQLGADTPVFVEHLPDHDAYLRAAATMRSAAEKAGVRCKSS
ncbi:MAG: sugar phosphate isomerase/epimerase [Clostridia bacterium]|nr:sugar phosphate isomerase/epimerase [Clostridia bacterium]